MFGPKPATHSHCTIGGMIGNNSCGSSAQAYGKAVWDVAPTSPITGFGPDQVIDVTDLTYLDSIALPPLRRWAKAASRAGQPPLVRGVNQDFDPVADRRANSGRPRPPFT